MNLVVELTVVALFALGLGAVLWAPFIAFAVRREKQPDSLNTINRIWATFGIVGAALAFAAFLVALGSTR